MGASVLQISGAVFAEPSSNLKLEDEALVIHKRTDPAHGTHLGIFVHGLGGSRYGEKATWGELPKLLFEDFPNLDIGMYSYRTLFRRLKFWKSVSIPQEAQVLGDLLLTLEGYEHLIFFGHSLGGVLCKATLVHLWRTGNRPTLEKLKSLFLLATPQLGSHLVPGFVSHLSYDFQALRQNGEYLTDLARIFQDNFHCAEAYPLNDKIHIPCWALIASHDFWVDGLSAGISLDASQFRTVRGSHTSVVKPKSRDDDSYRHLSAFMRKTFEHNKGHRNSQCRPATEEDLVLIHELAISLFGSDVSPLELMRNWWEQNPFVFWLLRRVTRAPGRRVEEAVGYFCLMPISAETAQQLRRGNVKASELSPEFLLKSFDTAEALYVGAIAGLDFRAKAEVMLALTTRLYSLEKKGRKIAVITHPVTSDGLRVVKQYEMDPIDDANKGLGGLYQFLL